MSVDPLFKYYNGFFIDKPVGNNAFSYSLRQDKRLFVAPIIEGGLGDLAIGNETVFSEFHDGREINVTGLRRFIYMKSAQKQFFIFDNHNHAFFFWMYGLKTGSLKEGLRLKHVDQHTDMRDPEDFPSGDLSELDLDQAFEYTNYHLNVGNFLKPALKLGIFSEIEVINSRAALERSSSGGYALDLDMDFFADEMSYIDSDVKIEKIQDYIERSAFITIATSPYFIDQHKAIAMIRKVLAPWDTNR